MINPPFKRTLLATLAGTGKPPELTFEQVLFQIRLITAIGAARWAQEYIRLRRTK